MKINDLTWMIGGAAGFGIQSAGHIFALAASRAGLHVFGTAEYPSLIRGGHNSDVIRVSDREVMSFNGRVLVLRWLDPEVQGRYGTMVYVRCGPEGEKRPPPKPKAKPKPKPKPAAAPLAPAPAQTRPSAPEPQPKQ